jgi:hypothetical protein
MLTANFWFGESGTVYSGWRQHVVLPATPNRYWVVGDVIIPRAEVGDQKHKESEVLRIVKIAGIYR